MGLHSNGRLFALSSNIRLGWKGMAVENTLAYLQYGSNYGRICLQYRPHWGQSHEIFGLNLPTFLEATIGWHVTVQTHVPTLAYFKSSKFTVLFTFWLAFYKLPVQVMFTGPIYPQKSNIHRMLIASQFTVWLLNQYHYNQVQKLVLHRFILNFSVGFCGLILLSDF